GASALHGTHEDAQKFSTTTLPRSDASASFPGASSRESAKAGAGGVRPPPSFTPLSWCTTFQIRRPSNPATTATVTACRPCFNRKGTPELCRDDEDGRSDLDVVEQPLGVRDVHPDAAV